MASRERAKSQNKENKNGKKALTYIKYRDHVLFKNCDSSGIKPLVRETIGWLSFENQEVICICSDLPIDPLPKEKMIESGFVILKSEVLEKHELDLSKQFKPNRETYDGQI
jgi:hypothetical protein